MSDTKADMAKVTQMLDADWDVRIYKNGLGSYEARATHHRQRILDALADKLRIAHESVSGQEVEYDSEFDWDGEVLITDDFTPEQALTRLAYKVHGEII